MGWVFKSKFQISKLEEQNHTIENGNTTIARRTIPMLNKGSILMSKKAILEQMERQ
jgi:hypothetical protein